MNLRDKLADYFNKCQVQDPSTCPDHLGIFFGGIDPNDLAQDLARLSPAELDVVRDGYDGAWQLTNWLFCNESLTLTGLLALNQWGMIHRGLLEHPIIARNTTEKMSAAEQSFMKMKFADQISHFQQMSVTTDPCSVKGAIQLGRHIKFEGAAAAIRDLLLQSIAMPSRIPPQLFQILMVLVHEAHKALTATPVSV